MNWEERIDAVWAASGEDDGEETIARIDALAAERGVDDARAEFERAGARDSAGREVDAVELYRRALALGLDDEHHPQAVIQLASTLRNLGEYDEALVLLEAQRERIAMAGYQDAAAVVESLILASAGKPAKGLSVALLALVPHLPRYHRSMTAYAHEIAGSDT